jgi:hypothetical protein
VALALSHRCPRLGRGTALTNLGHNDGGTSCAGAGAQPGAQVLNGGGALRDREAPPEPVLRSVTGRPRQSRGSESASIRESRRTVGC